MLGKFRSIPEYRFIATVLLATAIFLTFILAAAILVDPYGIFGLRLVEPLVLTNRDEKLSFLRATKPAPDAIIPGSSRVFLIDPNRIERLTGLRAFNASVSYARPEEYLAMTRHIVEDLGIKPKLVIVGVNVGELNHDPIDPQTITNSKLRRYLPISKKEQVTTILAVLKERFNPNMVRDIFLALFYRARGYPGERVTFLSNGVQEFNRSAPPELEKIERTLHTAIRLFSSETELSENRIKYFAAFIRFADEHGIEVRVAILPMPPRVVEALKAETLYPKLLEDLKSFLEGETRAHANLRVFDATELYLYNGDPQDFNDATHPGPVNLDRITDFILSDYRR